MGRSIVVLKLSRKVGDVLSFAQNVVTSLTNNPSFPDPTPPLAKLQTDITALMQAESAILSRTKGAFEARNARLAVVRTDLESLRAYVQAVVDEASPTESEALIEKAGLALRRPRVLDKPALAATRGDVSGTVRLTAKAVASRVLESAGVVFVHAGRTRLVSVAELERKLQPLWEGIALSQCWSGGGSPEEEGSTSMDLDEHG